MGWFSGKTLIFYLTIEKEQVLMFDSAIPR